MVADSLFTQSFLIMAIRLVKKMTQLDRFMKRIAEWDRSAIFEVLLIFGDFKGSKDKEAYLIEGLMHLLEIVQTGQAKISKDFLRWLNFG